MRSMSIVIHQTSFHGILQQLTGNFYEGNHDNSRCYRVISLRWETDYFYSFLMKARRRNDYYQSSIPPSSSVRMIFLVQSCFVLVHGGLNCVTRQATATAAISNSYFRRDTCSNALFRFIQFTHKKNHVAHCNQRASVFIRILSCVNRCMFCVFTYMRSFEQHFGWRRLEPLFHLSYYTLMQKSSQVLICVCNNILNIETVSMW